MFRDLGGGAHLCREMDIDSSNVLTEPDPREILAVAFRLSKVDRVMMTRNGFGSDEKFRVADLLD